MTESRAGDLFQPGDLVNNTYRIEAILGRGGHLGCLPRPLRDLGAAGGAQGAQG